MPQVSVVRQRDLFSFIAKALFGLSVILALGVVGYKAYLNYSIREMGAELERTRAALATGQVDELIRLNDRIVSTGALIESHRVLSPVFDFLETSTPSSVRFTDFNFLTEVKGLELVLKGEARSYAALAFEADTVYKNKDLKDPVFSDIRLDERGNVTFSLKAIVSPELLSYVREVKKIGAPSTGSTSSPQAGSGQATSTLKVATSTATSTRN